MRRNLQQAERPAVFYSMDMLRGIAALAVVAGHLDHALASLMPQSFLAVDLFFVLSGFVIAHAYEQKLLSTLSVGGFLKIRLIRLYPLYILGSVLGALIALALLVPKPGWVVQDEAFVVLMANMVYSIIVWPVSADLSFDGLHAYPLNFPAWSLFWEAVVNIAYVLMVRALSTRVLIGLILISGVVFIASTSTLGHVPGGARISAFAWGIVRVVFPFFMGVGLHRAWLRGWLRWSVPSPVLALILVAVFTVPVDDKLLTAYDLMIVLVVFPLLVALATRIPAEGLFRLYLQLGFLSYPLYALHGPLTTLMLRLYSGFESLTFWPQLGLELAFMACVLWASIWIGRAVDEPLRKWLIRKTLVPRPAV